MKHPRGSRQNESAGEVYLAWLKRLPKQKAHSNSAGQESRSIDQAGQADPQGGCASEEKP
ncbi:MAG TPA: hypothetical protein VGR15_08185 [Bacteroidota bacterium]|nr:hypothetical protein [Bacteroidota bacterium]